ncbi:hypothetical protein L1987_34475 [Smallanthus sonchifolius]|uniref:Uncharacterized protein n=1 Tax=Smallanthus sonchifolius TaxID=185202 RepID=A0ACB9HTW8_9ASTR|nr:hypothetical protein L1987_34475 [Smallanthus sonchifolius]
MASWSWFLDCLGDDLDLNKKSNFTFISDRQKGLIPALQKHWSRSYFTGRALSDVLLNNMCEVLNSKLLDGRDKPIITMLEYIREYLMRRIMNVLQIIDRSNGLLTPYATKIFESIKKEAARYTVKWNGEEHYQ